MAARKVTITIDEDVLAILRALARDADLPLSTYVTRAAEHHARMEAGRAAMQEWEDEHGAFTQDELADAASDIARAEATGRAQRRSAS